MDSIALISTKNGIALARDAFKAITGKPVTYYVKERRADEEGRDVTCEDLFTAEAVLTWFAAQAALQGGDYVFYLNAAQAMHNAAVAQGCPVP